MENSIFQLFAYLTVFLNLNPIFLQYHLESYRLESFQLVQQFKRLLHSSLAIFFSFAKRTAAHSMTNIVSCSKRSASVPKKELLQLCSQPKLLSWQPAKAILLSAGPNRKTWLIIILGDLKYWSYP